GRGQFARVTLHVSPRERGSGILFVDRTKGGPVPAEFIPAVEAGIRDASTSGVLAGYPVLDIEVALTGGQAHEVDSSEVAFRIAAAEAFRTAL
ncbi:MAG: elongation factor G, partial [Gemmatimonadales bacterium]|nr:elongation factor G [Gemmatimonadales bacterium]